MTGRDLNQGLLDLLFGLAPAFLPEVPLLPAAFLFTPTLQSRPSAESPRTPLLTGDGPAA